jgi:hypothetical protein
MPPRLLVPLCRTLGEGPWKALLQEMGKGKVVLPVVDCHDSSCLWTLSDSFCENQSMNVFCVARGAALPKGFKG